MGESFPRLSKDYADEFKGGNRTPNLELDGDMLDSLEFRTTTSGVRVGIFDKSEQDKADGHNNFSGKSKLPTRRFIPKSDQQFRPVITSGIEEILDRYREDENLLDDDLFPSAISLAGSFVTDSSIEEINIDDILSPFGSDI